MVSNGFKRSSETIHMIIEETMRDGTIVSRSANIPIGVGYQDADVSHYQKLGWEKYEDYRARKLHDSAAAEREAVKAAAMKAAKADKGK